MNQTSHKLTIPEPDQRVGGGFKWMGGCWFRCGGREIQMGRDGLAWGGGGRRPVGGGFKCGGSGKDKRWNGGCKGAKGQMLEGRGQQNLFAI